jgi:hypothetical protein
MAKELIPVLAVALITWGGVLLYLVRITAMLKSVARDVETQHSLDNQTP